MVGPISNWHVMFSKIKYLWIYFKYVIKGKCGSKNKQCLRIVKTLPSELISGFHVFVLEYRHSSTLQSSLIFPAGIIWCTCGYSWGFFSKLPSVIIYRITAAEGMAESYTLCIIRTGILICELSRWLIWDVIIMLMVRISSQEGNFCWCWKGWRFILWKWACWFHRHWRRTSDWIGPLLVLVLTFSGCWWWFRQVRQ